MRSRLAAIPALVLVALAIWEIVATRRDAGAVPGDDAWGRAAAVVRAGYRSGDLIVFAPQWADPIGRLHLGDLIPLDVAGRMDADRYGRIWELSMRGASAPETAGLVPVETTPGDVEVRHYERKPAVVVSELRDNRTDLVEVAFEPHRCVVVQVPPNTPVKVPWHATLGSELVGYFGIADVFTRRENREPVELAVEVGGQRVTASAPIDEWVRFRAPTTPGPADVTFVLSWTPAGEREGAKGVCLAVEARQ